MILKFCMTLGFFWIIYSCKVDGNCLYNACSTLLIGSENLASLLRAAVTLDLYKNAEYYSSHPCLASQYEKFPDRKTVIKFMVMSFDASDSVSSIKSIVNEAERNAVDRNLGTLMTMFVFSSVVLKDQSCLPWDLSISYWTDWSLIFRIFIDIG